MIVGAHSIVYSRDPERDRAFLRDVLGLPHVDAGGGWLVFGLPPAEVAVHPAERNDVHEFYLLTDDVAGLVSELGQKGVECSAPETLRWGVITHVKLPGGGRLGIYEPRHARPVSARRKATKRSTGRRSTGRRKAQAKRPRPSGTPRRAGAAPSRKT